MGGGFILMLCNRAVANVKASPLSQRSGVPSRTHAPQAGGGISYPLRWDRDPVETPLTAFSVPKVESCADQGEKREEKRREKKVVPSAWSRSGSGG